MKPVGIVMPFDVERFVILRHTMNAGGTVKRSYIREICRRLFFAALCHRCMYRRRSLPDPCVLYRYNDISDSGRSQELDVDG